MSNYQKLAEAFTIFAKYGDGENYEEIAAEHDVIYAGPDARVVSEEDIDRLMTLGWYDTKAPEEGFYYYT